MKTAIKKCSAFAKAVMVTAKKTSVTQLEAASGESQLTVFDLEVVDSCSTSTEAEINTTRTYFCICVDVRHGYSFFKPTRPKPRWKQRKRKLAVSSLETGNRELMFMQTVVFALWTHSDQETLQDEVVSDQTKTTALQIVLHTNVINSQTTWIMVINKPVPASV